MFGHVRGAADNAPVLTTRNKMKISQFLLIALFALNALGSTAYASFQEEKQDEDKSRIPHLIQCLMDFKLIGKNYHGC